MSSARRVTSARISRRSKSLSYSLYIYALNNYILEARLYIYMLVDDIMKVLRYVTLWLLRRCQSCVRFLVFQRSRINETGVRRLSLASSAFLPSSGPGTKPDLEFLTMEFHLQHPTPHNISAFNPIGSERI